MDQILNGIASELGLSATTVVLLMFIVSKGADLVGRLIPDDATGWKGFVRKAAKVVGVYVGNRVTQGVSTNDVAKTLAKTELNGRVEGGKFGTISMVDRIKAMKE